MTRTPDDDRHPVLPGCEPWSSPGGGPHGVLVLHGYTGSPVSMRPLAEAFASAGFAVELPRLPGHGTHVDDLIPTTWDDWLGEARRALHRLRERAPGEIVVAGLSMGGALTCALAADDPGIAGIVAVNAPMGLPDEMAEVIQAIADSGEETFDSIGGDIADPEADEVSYDRTPVHPLLSMVAAGRALRERLGHITCPALVITSRQDHVVPPTDSDLLAGAVSGPVERLWLERSYHVATLDLDRAELEAAATAFATRVTATTQSAASGEAPAPS